jgi:hypothetical protein
MRRFHPTAVFGQKRQSNGEGGAVRQESQRKRRLTISVFGQFRQSFWKSDAVMRSERAFKVDREPPATQPRSRGFEIDRPGLQAGSFEPRPEGRVDAEKAP